MRNFRVAIRDDDTSFWTKPEDLESVYGDFFQRGGKVSLAVIPCSWKQVNAGIEPEFYIDKNSGRRFIYENKSLVDYLKEKLKEGKIEIMQHGYDHCYGVEYKGKIEFMDKKTRENLKEEKNYKYLPECIYKSPSQLEKDLKEGKEILEDTFGIKIKVFVPPGNALSADAVKIIAKLGMHISGIIERTMNRPLSFRTILNYTKRIYWKLRFNHPYPFVMDYGTHKELTAYALTPSTNFKRLLSTYELCLKVKAPFVLATHYWEVLRHPFLQKEFSKILSLPGLTFKFLKEFFEE